jgi:hypothetical protein
MIGISEVIKRSKINGKDAHSSTGTFADICSLGRNLLGGIFPLVTNAMFTNLGYPEASRQDCAAMAELAYR